ncbi:hypothetical protein JCM6882_002238 [Rhodosporidiobolus microsporus]
MAARTEQYKQALETSNKAIDGVNSALASAKAGEDKLLTSQPSTNGLWHLELEFTKASSVSVQYVGLYVYARGAKTDVRYAAAKHEWTRPKMFKVASFEGRSS